MSPVHAVHPNALLVVVLITAALPSVAAPARGQARAVLPQEDSLAGLAGADRARVLVDLTVELRSLAPADAVAYGQEALELLNRVDDPATRVRALNEMGWAYMELGEYELAIEHAELGRTIAEAENDPRGLSRALNNLGVIQRRLGGLTTALDYFERSIEVLRSQSEADRAEREVERLAAEDALQRLEAQRQLLEARQRSTLMGIMLLLALVGLLLYRRSVVRAKLIAQADVRSSLESVAQERTLELQEANVRLEGLSLTDALTGLKNRRYLAQTLDADVASSLRMYRRAALENGDHPGRADIVFFMLDLDHFKSINDEYGHTTGDRVLVEVAEVLAGTCRASDTLLRWGGEEFLIVSRQVDRGQAEAFAERVRQRVAEQVFDTENGNEIKRTCSVGFASFPFIREHPDAVDWERVVELADAGLYEAKRRGRNGWVGVSSTAMTAAGSLTEGVESLEQYVAQGVLGVESSF